MSNEYSVGEELRRWVNNHPVLSCLSAALLVVAGGGLLAALQIGCVKQSGGDDSSTAKVYIDVRAKIDSRPVAPVVPVEPKIVYDPPTNKQVYKKFMVEGEIVTVEFDSHEPYISDAEKDEHHNPKHYMPDFTRVTYDPPWDDAKEATYDFCGNQLALFTPGRKLKIQIEESDYGDYNGCLILPGHAKPFTFGGKPLPKEALPQTAISKVPGQ